MSKFDELRIRPKTGQLNGIEGVTPKSKFEGLRTRPKRKVFVPEKNNDNQTKRDILLATLEPNKLIEPLYNNNFVKGAISGIGRAGMSEAAEQAGAGVMEVAPGVVVPISESSAMANIPEKGLEALESMKPDENDTLGNIAYKAGEFGGATASMPMMPARGAINAAANTGKSLFGRFGKEAAMGSAIGGASGAIQEATDIDPFYADLIAIGTTPGALRQTKSIFNNFNEPKRLVRKAMGLTKEGGLDIPAATAARDLEIDLPAAALTDSNLTGLADQWISKTPVFGNKLRNKYLTANEQTRKALEDIYDQTSQKRTPELESKISELYGNSRKTLPKESNKRSVIPVNTNNTMNELYDEISNSDIFAKDTKDLLAVLKSLKKGIDPVSTIKTKYGSIKAPIQPYDVKKLINAKMNLNAMIKWDTDEGIKNLARKLQKAVSDDISEYGKLNPEWHKTYREADKLFGDLAKRERLEEMLGQKATNYGTDGLSYNNLAKAINNPKNAEIIQKQVTPEVYSKIQKLGQVARAMASKTSRVPNPSGTATTSATIGGLGTLIGLLYDPTFTGAAVGTGSILGSWYGSKLLTDKKFLDMALEYAEKPTLSRELTLNKYIKDKTGYSAVALRNKLLENNDDK